MFWDFLSLTPESVHQVTILFSDRGTPRTYRNMNGFSSHTFKWYNEKGEIYFVKYHFKTEQGILNFTDSQAEEMKGKDPDHATRDLFNAIEEENYPSWRLEVQIMPAKDAENYRFDPFDITKVWPHEDYPPKTIGRLVLNQNPENYFAEVEQAAFSPANFVPGIAASPDKLLQGRLFSYHDTHRHRLDPNYHLIPVNRAKNSKTNNYQRDGFMQTDNNGGSSPNYYPNSFEAPRPDKSYEEPAFNLSGQAYRHEYKHPNDDFVQAGNLYRDVMTDTDRSNLINNITGHLNGAKKFIQLRQAALFYKADEEYGSKVAEKLGLEVSEVKKLAGMSQEERVEATRPDNA